MCIKILTEEPEDGLTHWVSCPCNIHDSFIMPIALNFSVFAVESFCGRLSGLIFIGEENVLDKSRR